MHSLGAQIVTVSDFEQYRQQCGKIVVTSGYFDPIHPGHISCFQESKKYGDTLIVLVDGDKRLVAKKGKPFQDIATRCSIVSGIRGVDFVIPLEIEGIDTPSQALEALRPQVFTKGGDRTGIENIPEWDVCQRHSIEIVTSVGHDKVWSSSIFLKEWADFVKNNN